MVVYLPVHREGTQRERRDGEEVVCERVQGTGLGVAALEFSEALELLCDPDADTAADGDGPQMDLREARIQGGHAASAWASAATGDVSSQLGFDLNLDIMRVSPPPLSLSPASMMTPLLPSTPSSPPPTPLSPTAAASLVHSKAEHASGAPFVR